MPENTIHIKNPGHKACWCHAFTDVYGQTYRWHDFPASKNEVTYTYDTKFKLYSWMFGQSGGTNFEPIACTPIVDQMTITFYEDRTEISHWAIDIVNQTANLAWFRASYKDGSSVDIQVAANASSRWVLTRGDDITDISVMYVSGAAPRDFRANQSVTTKPKTGQTFTVQNGQVIVEDLKLKLPVSDIAVKIWNQSPDFVWIRIYYENDKWVWFTLRANQPPFIWFMPQHPINIQYSRTDPKDGWKAEKVIPYKSGMTVSVRPRQMMNTPDEICDIITKLGFADKYGALFDKHELDLQSFLELTDEDMREIGLPIGPRKKIRREIQKMMKGPASVVVTEEGKWDIFLSHRQINGADLAQAIKLQLELAHPMIRVFLDVDDLNNVHVLEENVKNSKNVLLLITEGVLERPFVQKEIRAAIQNKKNIILVHDERNCHFPSGEGIPEDVRDVLAIKAIPYYREKAFRDVCIQQIWAKMAHGPHQE